MVLYVRDLTKAEKARLHSWVSSDDAVMRRRARVVLLSSRGYRVPEIGPMVDSHPANLRKWIHRFNERGCEGLRTVHSGGPKRRFSAEQRAEIVRLAQSRPRQMGLNFTRWTLHRLAKEATQRGLVDRISHECVRQILRQANCDYRNDGSGQRR
jgi:transposase